jgi:5'-3' exonuclease
MNIKCNLIVDLNYILMRAVFTLSKSNVLYGNLSKALETSVTNYRSWFPFSKVYLVSDSKEKSWRKSIYNEYKANRKRDNDIDWDFVYSTYDEFKKYISDKGFRILELGGIEGDDWISYVVQTSNLNNICNIIVSNDHDIKQLLKFDENDGYINIMTNEIFNKTKLFLPQNYNIFINKLKKQNNDDIFCLNNNVAFIKMISSFIEKHEVVEINPIQSLVVKIISGDSSDNISSVWNTYSENGKRRGVGEKSALDIFEKYILEFGEPSLEDPELVENIADLVLEKRKVPASNMSKIIENLSLNKQLVDLRLSNLPNDIIKKMENKFNNYV